MPPVTRLAALLAIEVRVDDVRLAQERGQQRGGLPLELHRSSRRIDVPRALGGRRFQQARQQLRSTKSSSIEIRPLGPSGIRPSRATTRPGHRGSASKRGGAAGPRGRICIDEREAAGRRDLRFEHLLALGLLRTERAIRASLSELEDVGRRAARRSRRAARRSRLSPLLRSRAAQAEPTSCAGS